MIKCSKECEPLCDFCKHFIEDDNICDDVYSDGYCNIDNKSVSRCDYCENNFHCTLVE